MVFVGTINKPQWQNYFRILKKNIKPDTKSADWCNSLGSAYVEHHLSIREVRDVYPHSYIDADYPEQSEGLSTVEARFQLRKKLRKITSVKGERMMSWKKIMYSGSRV